MKLKDFIKSSLVEICEGIADAQNEIEERRNNCPIAPARVEGKDVAKEQLIEFDIAVIVTESGRLDAEGGVNIKVLGKGAEGKIEGTAESKQENNHKIKFSVPFYPQGIRGKK